MRRLACLLAVPALALASIPTAASAQQLRFSTTAPGAVIGTGNTLGLSKATGPENGPGIRDSIGTFLTLGATVDDMPADATNPWPLGTTSDWTVDGSTAVLTLPSESSVLYAELVWGGSTNYVEDVTPFLDTPVTLSIGGNSISVTPDPATKLDIAQTAASGFLANYYMRSANVTQFVASAGAGTYSVEGVPATQNEQINSLNAAGWTLVVAVKDTTQPVRNLSVFVGGSFVDENSQQDYTVNGLCTPPAGAFDGHVVISAIEGDANLVGDQLLIAANTSGPFVNLDGPNNPSNNFFCSQLNGSDGQLDTQGSFGDSNQDAIGGANVAGGRQGWDVTTVALSSQDGQLANGQTSAVLRTITTGDSYVPTVAAFAIGVNAPDFTGAANKIHTDKSVVMNGDTIELTLDLANGGLVTAEQLKLGLPIDPHLSLVSFQMDGQSGDINGNPVDGAALQAGVDAGSLAPAETRHVVIDFTVNGAPSGVDFSFHPDWSYVFEVCSGGVKLPESYGQYATVAYDANAATSSSSSAATTGSGTTTGAGGSSSGAGGQGGDGAGVGNVDEGCGCSVPGSDERPLWPLAAIVALGGVSAARRRRARR